MWLVGVVVRRYIDFLILLIPTPLVSVLFCSSIPTFCSLKNFFSRSLYSTVHPESFRSNAQITIAFARRNRPRVHRNDEVARIYLRSRAFASTVRDRPRARTYVNARRELHLKSIK